MLGGMLIGLLLTASMQYRPLKTLSLSGLESSVVYEARELPTLRSPWITSIARNDKANLRDPFSFPSIQRGVKKTPQSLQLEAMPESPKNPGARTTVKDQRRAVTFEYLGYVGPFRRPFAVFRHDGEIELAMTGQALDGGYVLRKFNETAAVFTHTVDGKRRRVSVVVSER